MKIKSSSMDEEHCNMESITHPLHDTWTFRFKQATQYQRNQSEHDWLKSYKKLYEFNTIEDFWRLFNNIPDMESISKGTLYSFFRNDIKPSWEAPENKNGSSLQMYLNEDLMGVEQLKKIYRDIMCLLVGASTKGYKHLNGCTIDKKYSGYKITLWYSVCEEKMKSECFDDLLELVSLDTYNIDPDQLSISVSTIDHKKEIQQSEQKKKKQKQSTPVFYKNQRSYKNKHRQ